MSYEVQIRNEHGEVVFSRSLDEWNNIELTDYGAPESKCRNCGNNEFIHVRNECAEFCRECGEAHYY